ncbi:DUF5752 family protein [archaeon]|nr:DUF5752 family protein [archaeon]
MVARNVCVDDGQAFWFSDWNGSVGFVAHDVREFKKGIKEVSDTSLEFHLREDKNDFSAWLEVVLSNKNVADAFWGVKSKCLTGRELRRSLLKCFKPKKKVIKKFTSKKKSRKSIKQSLRRALVGKK